MKTIKSKIASYKGVFCAEKENKTMANIVFADYYMVEEERLKGYAVANVCFGINAADSGMLIELEREIDNVTLGIDILYDPDHEELEEPCQISQEYVKCIREI